MINTKGVTTDAFDTFSTMVYYVACFRGLLQQLKHAEGGLPITKKDYASRHEAVG